MKIAWGAKVSEAFCCKVIYYSSRLGINPSWLMACMYFETGGTFSPSIKNPRSSATGLIQFMASTAAALGTTTDDLARMEAEDQLLFVYKYFQPKKGKLHSVEDVYMWILWPKAVGKPLNYVLFEDIDPKYRRAYRANAGLDLDRDGDVDKFEATAKIRALLDRGLLSGNYRECAYTP